MRLLEQIEAERKFLQKILQYLCFKNQRNASEKFFRTYFRSRNR